MSSPRQLSLITEPSFYHDVSKASYIALLARQTDGAMRQKAFHAAQLDKVIQAAPRDRDCYLSQAQFILPNRRAVNLYSLPLLFCDLDPPSHRRDIPPDEWRHAVLMFCRDEGIPAPSLIVYSGRGVHLKWILEQPLPRAELSSWNTAQEVLGERFAPIGADPQARDASRVLRLEHTVNTKTGRRCEVIWVTDGGDGRPIRYPFDVLCDEASPARGKLERLRESLVGEETAKPPRGNDAAPLTLVKGGRYGLKRINYQELAWHRLEDLRALAEMRAARQGGAEPLKGQRMLFLFWCLNFMALSNAVTPASFWKESQSLAASLAPGWDFNKAELSTVYQKTKAYSRREVVDFDGRKVPPLYTPRNATLIERFTITDDEQRQLRTIVSKNEARRRDAARKRQARRASGVQERAAYEAPAQHRRELARVLRGQGASNSEIAEQLGVHVKSVPRLLRG